ncbi:MAG: Flp pilus assembly protein CpaB [Candidatus Omnitrophica bacterium]|nr:Flp pilus assembly protein CpaB [Candidatus Omnitrophota bacterium]
MPRERLILIIGIGLSLVAVLFAGWHLKQFEIRKEREIRKKLAQLPKEQEVSVLVAVKEIPKGVEVRADSVEVKKMSKEYAQPGSVSNLPRIRDMLTVVPINEGEQITLNKLTYPTRGGALSEVTPPGKRAVTIAVDSLGGLAGMVKPADRVDIYATIAVPGPGGASRGKKNAQLAVVPVFQNVQILAVGRSIGRRSPVSSAAKAKGKKTRPGSKSSKASSSKPASTYSPRRDQMALITIALTAQEANLMAFVQDQGRLRLTMRSAADSKIEHIQPANWDTFFRHVMPYLVKKETKPKSFIEVYRGINKESVPVYKQ